MASQNQADHELVAALHKLSNKSPKLVRSSTYPAPADPNVTIRSWKMNEFKYYDVPSPFPTLARGLFTRWDGTDDAETKGEGTSNGKYTIVARGYDKFFNIGEVPWTSWKALEAHTASPYVLTLKSNGCIIFIAPLTPSKLLITSKHSIGPIKGQAQSHAEVGERWLHKHLESIGKTETDLAKSLWDNNLTAVAELCDDSFEEHVLPYSAELTGLHLHGLNSTTGTFQTRNPEEVETFAREWGFIPTAYITLNTIPEVREFTQKVSETGIWNGQPIEGFVVRTHIAVAPSASATASEVPKGEASGGRHARGDRDAPPYPSGSSFFFKVKFDEPYMMYRDWRELTKSLLTVKPGSEPRISKAKLNRLETRLYRKWVEDEIKHNRKAFDGYINNKGIIATRERFLKWCREEEGKSKLELEMEKKLSLAGETDVKKPHFGTTVIVPIGIPGCGKTSIAVALKHLFGFGHTQSDDVKAKKIAPIFLKNVTNLLKTHDVVIADKNNHLVQHREGLRSAIANIQPSVRLVALNWSLDQPPAMIHRICGDRVQARGENHQSLRPDEHKGHEDVIWMFIEKTEALGENEVDEVIEMDIAEDLENGLSRAVDGLVRILGLERPSDERIGEALTLAKTYKPQSHADKKSPATKEGKEKKPSETERARKPPRYFGLLPELDLNTLIVGRLAEADAPPETKKFWDELKTAGRVTQRPHITIVHSKALPKEQTLWDRCSALDRSATPPLFSLRLGHIVCDERLMALTVEDMKVLLEGDKADLEAGAEFLENLPQEMRKHLHITVGTRNSSINPFEASSLLEQWRNGGAMVTSIPLNNAQSHGRVKGLKF